MKPVWISSLAGNRPIELCYVQSMGIAAPSTVTSVGRGCLINPFLPEWKIIEGGPNQQRPLARQAQCHLCSGILHYPVLICSRAMPF